MYDDDDRDSFFFSRDIGELFFTGDNYDLIIQAGEGQNMKEFFAHSLILSARSEYFKTALSKEWARKENGIIIFKKPNISPEIIEIILKYLCAGKFDFGNKFYKKKERQFLINFLIATDELNLERLSHRTQTYLIDDQKDFLRNNPIDILQIIFRNESYENLCKFCINIICENPKILFESPESTSLEKDIIIFFLKQNEFEIEETLKIWEFVLKWALTRMSTQQNIDNLSQWTLDNFNELEKILHDLIPLIRWFEIPEKIFRQKVNQFEPIFPKQLYKDIIGYYCDPNTLPTNAILQLINSVLISRDHLSIIASWIDKKEKDFYNNKSIPYSFKLLYRASRDGFETGKLRLCYNKSSTIVILKLKENGCLVGAYDPLIEATEENCGLDMHFTVFHIVCSDRENDFRLYNPNKDSFLFFFANKEEINSAFKIRENLRMEFKEISLDYYLYSNRKKIEGIIGVDIARENCDLEDYEIFQILKKHQY